MKSKSQILAFFFIFLIINTFAQDKIYKKPITHLSFGSCNRAGLNPEVWKAIGLQQSDVWIWLGDIVYGKTNKSILYDLQKVSGNYRICKCHIGLFWDL